MKVIDLTPSPANESSINKFSSQAQKIITDTFSIRTEADAQETLITQLGRLLSNQYVLIRNAPIEGLDVVAPIILVGPTGVSVFYASEAKGIFQAKGDAWAEMAGNRQFQPARPNLIFRTQTISEAVQDYLKNKGFEAAEVCGLLFFSHPGTHVDSIRPAVRILLVDGLEHYVSGLMQAPPVLSKSDAQSIIEAIVTPPQEPGLVSNEPAPKVSRERKMLVSPEIEGRISTFSRTFPLSSKQWILLGVMATVEIVVLVGFILLILTTT